MGADGWGRGRWKGEGACKYGCSGGGGSPAWLDPDPAARYSPAWHTLDPDPEARYNPAWHTLDPDPEARYSPAWHTLDPDPEAHYSPVWRTLDPDPEARYSIAWHAPNPDPEARNSPVWHTLDPDPEARYSPPQRTAISAMLSMYRCLISREAAAAASVAVAEPVASAWEIRCCWLRGEVGTTEGEG